MALTENEAIIGRDDINDLEAILAVTNTERDATVAHVESHFDTIFTWDYDKGSRPKLDRLYEKAKTSMWNGATDLPWEIEVDQEEVARNNAASNSTGLSQGMDVAGTPFEKWGDKEWLQVGVESQNWTLSQFMHGEQGALVCTARIVESVPWIDAKYYASTQVMDEARHVEVFAKYLDEKLSGHYPINAHLKMLLDDIIQDSRWDMTYLGMQIMVEGLALAAFGFIHQLTTEPLLKQLLRYVMSDEARHVAFGVLSLQDYYQELTTAELRERQEFAFEAAVRIRDRFLQQEVWERMGIPVKDAVQLVMQSARARRLPVDVVLEDRAELQEARPARRRRRQGQAGLAAREVHRARRDRVRGLGRHRRGVRDVRPRQRRDAGLRQDRVSRVTQKGGVALIPPSTAPPFARLGSVEDDDGAGDLALLHGFEAVVDLVERDARAHELVEHELAVHVEIDVARHVEAETVRAHVGALDLLLGEEVEAVQLDGLADRDHADNGGRAALAQHLPRLFGGLLETDCFEGILHAAARQRLDLGHGVARDALTTSVAPNWRAISSLVSIMSTAMIRDAPAMRGALDHVQADAATADHGDGRYGRDCGGAEHGAEARRHRAADERGAVQRHVLADLHQGVLVDQHLLAEARQVQELVTRAAVGHREPLRAGEVAGEALLRAAIGETAQAVHALAAEHRQAGDDVVAWLHVGDARARRPRQRRPTRGPARSGWGTGTRRS